MAKNTCKLCSRRFASPRALAGHMRAHSIAAAKSQISSASSASTSIAAGGGSMYCRLESALAGLLLVELGMSGFVMSSYERWTKCCLGAGAGKLKPIMWLHNSLVCNKLM